MYQHTRTSVLDCVPAGLRRYSMKFTFSCYILCFSIIFFAFNLKIISNFKKVTQILSPNSGGSSLGGFYSRMRCGCCKVLLFTCSKGRRKGIPIQSSLKGGLAIVYIHYFVNYMLICFFAVCCAYVVESCQAHSLYSCIYKILCYTLTFSKNNI